MFGVPHDAGGTTHDVHEKVIHLGPKGLIVTLASSVRTHVHLECRVDVSLRVGRNDVVDDVPHVVGVPSGDGMERRLDLVLVILSYLSQRVKRDLEALCGVLFERHSYRNVEILFFEGPLPRGQGTGCGALNGVPKNSEDRVGIYKGTMIGN